MMDNSLNRVHISLLIESEYRKRGVFPMLRFENAKVYGATLHFFNIPFDMVRLIKEDADEQYKVGNRRLKIAYGAVSNQMRTIIRRPEIDKEKRKREAEARKKFKDDAINGFGRFLGVARACLWKDDGYRFDNETLTDIESLICKLENILSEGRVVHPSDDIHPASDVAQDCKSNVTLQALLKSAASNLSLVKNESPEGV